jgi:hypothetical protein
MTLNTFDLRLDLLPISKIIKKGQCLPVSLCTIKEWQEHKNSTFWEYFSSDYIYLNRNNKNKSGISLNESIHISTTLGMLPEKYENNSEEEKLNIALQYKFNTYNYIDSINDLKYSLINNGPCCIILPLYNENNFEFWINNIEEQTKKDWHAVTVIGWTADAFILRNCWGPNWAYSGYTYFQFEHWNLLNKALTIF